ncbi:four helix bundle protein [Candidatus Uhrbacteria bacterium]|nr:four helix bundle protein [Candidatus Uhrbacteria bacterium]
MSITPPPNDFGTVPVIHKASEWYKAIYTFSSKISKKDRFGIYLKIEHGALELIDLLLVAALEDKDKKYLPLRNARLKTESLKRLIRICYEIGVVDLKHYINFEYPLQEISKMINGWIKYLR